MKIGQGLNSLDYIVKIASILFSDKNIKITIIPIKHNNKQIKYGINLIFIAYLQYRRIYDKHTQIFNKVYSKRIDENSPTIITSLLQVPYDTMIMDGMYGFIKQLNYKELDRYVDRDNKFFYNLVKLAEQFESNKINKRE